MAELVRITYVGKIKESGQVFDKGENTPIILEEKKIIQGLKEALDEMKEKEKRKIVIPPEKAFGERRPELVKLMPLKVFKANKIDPCPGMPVVLDNLPAKIQSVSGGRVRVDFNHELAGKTLEYDLKLEEKILKPEEKIKAVSEIVFGSKEKIESMEKNNELEIKLPKEVLKLEDLQMKKIALIDLIKKYVGIKKVKILEEY